MKRKVILTILLVLSNVLFLFNSVIFSKNEPDPNYQYRHRAWATIQCPDGYAAACDQAGRECSGYAPRCFNW